PLDCNTAAGCLVEATKAYWAQRFGRYGSDWVLEADMIKRGLLLVAALAAVLTVPVSGTRYSFKPDWTFSGNALGGWQVVGQATWKAENGELVGTPKSPEGGWLVLDRSFQDIEVGYDFKCAGECKTGLLLRAEKTAGGMKGVFVSIMGEPGAYAVTL